MKAKLVVISDLHLHPWAAFATGSGLENSRLKQTLSVLRSSLEYANEHHCLWFFAGDWVHTIGSVKNGVLNVLIDVLLEYPEVTKITVWGNHDSARQRGRIEIDETVAGVLQKSSIQKFYVLDDQTLALPINSLSLPTTRTLYIYGAGYQPAAEVNLWDNKVGPLNECAIGLYHQTLIGSETGGAYQFKKGLEVEELWKRHSLSIVGDIHHPQRFYAPDSGFHRAVLVPGSPEHHNFGDKGGHGWWIISLEYEMRMDMWLPTEFELVKSDSPEFRTVDTVSQVESGHFYRIKGEVSPENLPANAIASGKRTGPVGNGDRPKLNTHEPEAILQAWIERAGLEGDTKPHLATGLALLDETELKQPVEGQLRSVTLQNFMCYEYAKHEFTPGVTLVTGESKDFSSNGAGKTTLFDAVYWVLFGRTTKGLAADEVIRWGSDCAEVEIEIDRILGHEENYLTVQRKRVAGKTTLTAWWSEDDEIDAASQKELQEIVLASLGLTSEIFQALSYYSQEKVFLFSRATDSERKSVLSDLLGLRAYADAASDASAMARQLEAEIAREAVRVEALENEHNIAAKRFVEAEEKQNEWQLGQDTKIAAQVEKIHEVEDRGMTLIHGLRAKCVEPEMAVEVAKKAIEIVTEGITEHAAQQAVHKERLGGFVLVKERHEKDRAVLAANLAKVEARRCPTCGQPWWDAEYAESLRRQIADADRSRSVLDEDKEVWQDAIDTEGAKEAGYREQLATLQVHYQAGQEYTSAVTALRHAQDVEAAHLSLERERLRKLHEEESPWAKMLETWGARSQDLAVLVANGRTKIEGIRSTATIYEFWADGFGRQGIQSLLLEEIVAAFTEARVDIFPLLTHGVYDVQFSATSFTRTGEAREKTEFIIRQNGVEVPYESLSGGQRRRVDLGVMLTLLLAMCRTHNIPGILGLVVLDEVFGGLDSDGSEALAETLDSLSSTIPSVYLITHDPDLQALFPGSLRVVQEESGISRLE